MKNRGFVYTTLLASSISLVFLLLIPADQKNAWLFGFSAPRMLSLLVLLAGFALSLAGTWLLHSGGDAARRAVAVGERLLANRLVTLSLFAGSLIGTVLGTTLLLTFWRVDPKYEAMLLRAAPLGLFAYALCIQALMLVWPDASRMLAEISPPEGWRTRLLAWQARSHNDMRLGVKLAVGVLFLVLGIVYFNLANAHATSVNRQIASDQGANLLFTQRVVQSGYRYTGYRNQMPAYPFLLTAIYKPGLGMEELFQRGKRFNIVLSLVLLVLLFVVARRFLSSLGAVTLTLLTSFGLYVFKAGYVQVEISYYFISFLAYAFMGWMLVSPSLKAGIATGVLAGLAHLSKASILPGLVLFLCLFILKVTVDWLVMARRADDRPGLRRLSLLRYASGFFVLLFFLGIIFQYISESKRLYGQYFYNVNSTFYMWYDTWAQAKKGTRAVGDREGWPQMPPEEIPSLQKYLGEHTAADIIQRLQRGMRSQAEYLLDLYGRFDYLLILFLLVVTLAVSYYPVTGKLIRENFWLCLFVLGYFTGYLILYAWYYPITDNENQRMTYSLFLPFVFSAFIAMEQIARSFKQLDTRDIRIHPRSLVNFAYAAVLLLVFIDLTTFIPGAILSNAYSK